MVKKIVLLLVNGLGVGPMPDASVFHSAHINTLGHLAEVIPTLQIPHLRQIGLSRLTFLKGQDVPIVGAPFPSAFFSRCRSRSSSNDTLSLLWELCGVVSQNSFANFRGHFSQEFIDAVEEATEQKFLVNTCMGIEMVLDKFGYESMDENRPLLFTNGDSDIVLAAHQDMFSEDALFILGQKIFSVASQWNISKVRMISFAGDLGGYYRVFDSENTLSHASSGFSLFKLLANERIPVITTDRIAAAFDYQGIEETFSGLSLKQDKQMDRFALSVRAALTDEDGRCLIVQEITDFFDNPIPNQDTPAFASLLENFDAKLPILQRALQEDDILIISSLGGGDTGSLIRGTTREYLPLFVYGQKFLPGHGFAARASLADIAATIADLYGLPESFSASSFAKEFSH